MVGTTRGWGTKAST